MKIEISRIRQGLRFSLLICISEKLALSKYGMLLCRRKGGTGDLSTGKSAYLRQISWREYAHHVLFNFPYTETRPLDFEFLEFLWQHDKNMLRSWQEGRTGYPIVDAGMRQLWQMGWIHNRVRMVVASFFVKHLQLGNTVLSGFGVLW